MTSPLLSFRGLHYDLARGNYDSLPSLRRLVDFTAQCGLNALVFYMEDLWRYRGHPALSNPHAYEPAALGELARYAADQGVDFIPSLTTLGHAHHILGKPEYRALAFPGRHGDFDVNNPRVYDLFADLFDEVLPHFTSRYVFLNGDEVNLSALTPQARTQAQQNGLGWLYGTGMARLAEMVLQRRRRPIIWHDMLLHHPEAIDLLPRETVVTYWFYDYQEQYPAIEFFCAQGFDVLIAPGLLRHEHLPDYARAIPHIRAECLAAADVAGARPASPTCLGTLLTIWEKVHWPESALAIYAAGRWANNPRLPQDQMLADFARDVFGLDQPELGQAWIDGSRDLGRLLLQRAPLGAGRSDAERAALEKTVDHTRQRLHRFLAAAERGRPKHNVDIHTRLADAARLMAGYDGPVPPRPSPPPLLTPDWVKPGPRRCRLVTAKTPWDHDLIILTNGSLAVAILPQFGATLIEWVVLGRTPYSLVLSDYAAWAQAEPRTPGDPGLGSPWGAGSVGGWRECLFFNARLNPSSLWGRPFTVRPLEQSAERVTVECTGRNEVAHVVRTVSLSRATDRLTIQTTATATRGPCHLAIQPNVPHVFPHTCAALLQLIQWQGRRQVRRPLIDHDGTKLFVPLGRRVRVECPRTGLYLELRFDPRQVSRILTDCGPDMFTLEPFGVVRACRPGDRVRLRLDYRVGRCPPSRADHA